MSRETKATKIKKIMENGYSNLVEEELKHLLVRDLNNIIELGKRKEKTTMTAKEKFEVMNAGLQVTAPVGDFNLQDKGIIEVKVEKKEKVDDKKAEGDKLAIQLMIAWMYQTEHPYKGRKALFFEATKKDTPYYGNYITANKPGYHPLYAATVSLLERYYPELIKGKSNDEKSAIVNSAYNVMIKRGLCHKYRETDIHMSKEEYKKCWDFYKSNKVQGMVASYEAFLKGGK